MPASLGLWLGSNHIHPSPGLSKSLSELSEVEGHWAQLQALNTNPTRDLGIDGLRHSEHPPRVRVPLRVGGVPPGFGNLVELCQEKLEPA